MRVVQYQILKQILEKVEVPDYIYAFEKNKSVPKMALLHVDKKVVISLDLSDFFGSIKQFMVEAVFNKIGFTEKAGRTLSELCTYKSFVPQGALTSPKLSNVVSGMTFGPILKEYCDSIGATLTIYADDITISLSENNETLIPEIMRKVRATVNSFGFSINSEKQKVMYKSDRQYVCGAVVNEKLNLIKPERLRLRAMVHNVKHNGIVKEAQKTETTPSSFYAQLMGKLNWFKQLNPIGAEPLIEELKMYKELYNSTTDEPLSDAMVELV